jgi:hypothetical protein
MRARPSTNVKSLLIVLNVQLVAAQASHVPLHDSHRTSAYADVSISRLDSADVRSGDVNYLETLVLGPTLQRLRDGRLAFSLFSWMLSEEDTSSPNYARSNWRAATSTPNTLDDTWGIQSTVGGKPRSLYQVFTYSQALELFFQGQLHGAPTFGRHPVAVELERTNNRIHRHDRSFDNGFLPG